MMPPRPTYEITYALYIDGKETPVELVGTSKAAAYETLADHWSAHGRGNSPPPKRRCRLVEIDRVRWG